MRFFFHFNKPRSKSLGKPQISFHCKKTCHIVDNIVCKVPTRGRIRKTQPVFVVTGNCNDFEIVDNIVYVR